MRQPTPVRGTNVLQRNLDAWGDPAVRFVCNEGGSRSGKTTAIVQLLAMVAHERPLVVSIVRKTFPALRGSVMRDFAEVLTGMGCYDPEQHSRTENTYTLANGSVFEFFSCDDEMKLRGRKRDVLFCNEANELGLDEFNQLVLRTSGKVFLDLNPSDVESWCYDVAARSDARLIRSTYLDNPFVVGAQADYIRSLEAVDANHHRVYALGLRPTFSSRVYTHFTRHSARPSDPAETHYGLDLGYNDPTVLVRADWSGGTVHLEQLYWRTGRTTSDVVADLSAMGLGHPVWCDHRPEVVEELRRAGIDARNAHKDIAAGIDRLKSTPVSVHEASVELWDEVRRYSYRSDRSGALSDAVPLDRFNHGLDAARYAVYRPAQKPAEHRFFVFDG